MRVFVCPKVVLRVLFPMSLAALPGAPRAGAATLQVDPQGVGEGVFASISSAVDAANNGDTIEVAPGTYAEEISVSGKVLEIVSKEGAAKTKITGGTKLLTISTTPAAGSLVQGFTFEGAADTALRILAATVNVRDNVFLDNGPDSAESKGGAVFISSANSVFFERNRFEGNTAGSGGAIYVNGAVDLRFAGDAFVGNEASVGGAFFVEGTTNLTLGGVSACGNSATTGGFLRQTGGSLSVEAALLEGNTAGSGGALSLDGVVGPEDAPVPLRNFLALANSGTDAGPLAACTNTALDILNGIIAQPEPGAIRTDGAVTADYTFLVATSPAWAAAPGGDALVATAGAQLQTFDSLDALALRAAATACAAGAHEPLPSSPVVNAGTPELKDEYDKTRSDVGPYGGPAGLALVTDTDGDTHFDLVDNCPDKPNANQKDTDDDGIGDVCDPTSGVSDDADNDGVLDTIDNCPNQPNSAQADNDSDGAGDVCDLNDDSDPVPDLDDCRPLDPDIYPGQLESCNNLDDDCDELVDEDLNCLPEPEPDAGGGEGAPGDATDDTDAGAGAGEPESGGGGGGCAAGAGASSLVGLLLAGALARRRRGAARGPGSVG
jgi:predicted outer membrane repeat protein